MSRPSHRAGAAFAAATAITILAAPVAAQCEPEWHAMAGGTRGGAIGVRALTVFDDGSGPALYTGGGFRGFERVGSRGAARWNGFSWSRLGEGTQNVVEALVGFDDGSGPALYAAGAFGDHPVERWDGSAWRFVPGAPFSSGRALAVYDDGGGAALYAGGFGVGASAERIGRWDGSSWTSVGGGTDGSVRALAVFDDGSGPSLFAGGDFEFAGGKTVNDIARWGCPQAPCYADCDNDRFLDFFDFLCFQDLFAAGDPGADCDASGSIDFADFLCFQDAFTAGCP
jgi:hypothetical protein